MTPVELPTAASRAANVLGGRYVLGAIAGQGGASTVYKAVDQHTATTVAVKLFHPGVELSDSLQRRRREVQVASELHHPAIVKVLDADVEISDWTHGRAYIVTEFVDGPTFGQRLQQRPFSESQVASIGAELCDALAYMHEQGIVHRDLKPANILLTGEIDGRGPHPMLADFGLSLTIDSTRMTAVGMTAGTPTYLSPEQVRGLAISPASDIYALGLVLIEALTGEPAFAGHGVEAALARLTKDPMPPPNVDPRFTNLLVAMTAREPANRPTAAECGSRLSGLADGSLTSDLVAFAPATMLIPKARWRPFGLAAAIMALLCAGAAAAAVFALSTLLGGSSRTLVPPVDAAVAVSSSTPHERASLTQSPETAPIKAVVAAPEEPPAAANGPAASNPSPTKAAHVVVGTPNQVADNGHGKKPGNKKS
jgi:eukaryotic-like serine/threonine-protein kinase